MAKRKSFRQLVKYTCFKVIIEFIICILMLYLIPVLSIDISVEGKVINAQGSNSVFLNVFSWIYLCLALILIVSLNFLGMIRRIQREMEYVYHKSIWITPNTEGTIQLTIDELIETNYHIDKMQEKIKKMIEQEKDEKQELIFKVSAAAHDIKTPLTVIQGNAELLQQSIMNEREKECLQDIVEASGKMTGYFNEFIHYSKTFYDAREEWMNYKVKDVVEAIRGEVFHILKDKAVFTFTDTVQDNEDIGINLTYIIRAIDNMLKNAYEHADTEDIKVFINIEYKEEKLLIYVRNVGKHLSEDILKSYGKLFYSKDKNRNSKEQHYGIGLAFVERVAKLHNGSFSLKNVEDGVLATLSIST